MQFGSWKKALRERTTSKVIASSTECSDSPPSPNSSKHIGPLLERVEKLTSNTALKKTPELKDHGNLDPQSLPQDPALTSLNAKDYLTSMSPTKRLQRLAGNPGASSKKRSKNIEEYPHQPETSKLKFMYSGESLAQEKLDSLNSLQMLEHPTGWHLTPSGLMIMKAKRVSYSMTSMAPSPTQPSSGSWIEPNFDWKAKGATLISVLKTFYSQVTSNHQNGTMAVNFLWMPYDEESTMSSSSCATTNEPSSKDQRCLSSGQDGGLKLD